MNFKVDRNSARSDRLRSARSEKELTAIISDLIAEVDDLGKDTQGLLRAVSSSSKRRTISLSSGSGIKQIELGDMENAPVSSRRPVKKIGQPVKESAVKLPRMGENLLKDFVAPDMRELGKNNITLHRLQQNISELEVAEQVLLGGPFAKMDSSRTMRQQLRQAIKEARTHIANQLSAMAKIAKASRPKHHRSMVAQVKAFMVDLLDKRIYTDIQESTFVYKPDHMDLKTHDYKGISEDGLKNILYYQTFIYINNLLTIGGHVREDYSVVVTGVVDMTDGTLIYHITSLDESKVPGSFPIGKPLATEAEIKRKLQALVKQDTGNPANERMVMGLTTGQMNRTPDMAKLESVDAMRQQNDYLYFRLVRGLTREQELEAKANIIAAVDKIFYNKLSSIKKITSEIQTRTRPNVSDQIGRQSKRKYFRVAMISKNRMELTREKVKRLGQELNLSAQTINTIVQTVT